MLENGDKELVASGTAAPPSYEITPEGGSRSTDGAAAAGAATSPIPTTKLRGRSAALNVTSSGEWLLEEFSSPCPGPALKGR
jgi:hypothetical protein